MTTYLTFADHLVAATNTRAWGTRLEKHVALALARHAHAAPQAIGTVSIHDGPVPMEAVIRLWLPLEVSADYSNTDIRIGLMLLRGCHFLSDTYAEDDVWHAVLTPYLVPAVDAAYREGRAA